MTVSLPEFHTTRCTRYRYRYSNCQRCAEACPHDAVALLDEGIRLDTARCQNCALCTTACPTAALGADNLPRLDLLRRAIKTDRFSFACAPSGLAGDAVVPCLGALDAAMLAYLAKRRIAVALRGSRHCGQCAHGAKGETQLAAHLEAADTLEAEAAPEEWLAATLDDAPGQAGAAGDFRAGRRQLFRRLIGRGVDEVAREATPATELPVEEKAIRAGPWFVPEMRELLQIVCKRKNGEPFRIERQTALPLMDIRLKRGCTACEACFRVCPTGAMQIREDDENWNLAFAIDRCVGCGACLEVCQPRVLDAAESFDASPEREPAVLRQLAKQRCNRCDRFFVSSEPCDTCPVCADDAEAFTAIFGN
ncbi:MAG: 4Fe-4S dicluster domain-containing protein [Denitratisoma sp.]|nr:4Fe-4S dicluster domain-containing protein [Denitratisoma sp.]